MVKLNINNLVLCLAISLALISCVHSTPILLNRLFGISGYHEPSSSSGYSGNYNSNYYYNGNNRGTGYRPRSSTRRQAKGRSYNDICRVVAQDNYAVPGRVSAPFCPYT